MDQETLHEVTTYFININKLDELMSSWHNSTLAVRSEKGLHFYELVHNINCLDKKINFLQTFLPPAKSKASAKLFTDKVINSSMRNIDYTEMIHDQSLWPHNPQLMEEMTCVVYFEWSPVGLLANQESVLAVLNNIGGVDLFININSRWKHILEVAGSFSDNLRMTLSEPRGFAELKEAAHILSSTGMCWAPKLAGDKSCYIATAQKNDTIMFWLVLGNDSNVSVQFQGSVQSGEGEILAMRWIPISENHFVLVCSNIFGQIVLLACQIKNSLVQLKESHTIWSVKDKMISTQLQYITANDKIILICNKHRHLLVLMIDKNYKVCEKNISNITDYRISSITNSKDDIYLATINGKIFKINISINNTVLDVSLNPIEFNINPTCELYDISFSQNGVLCTLITVDRKVNFRKEPLKINVVLATTNKTLNSLVNTLLNNPTEKLTNYWDVVELLRYKCMKHKEAPSIVYSDLYEEACRNIYLLKLYLIFVTFYTNLKNLFKIDPIDNIPEESVDAIKEEVLVIHAEMLFKKYHHKRISEGHLQGLEMESFYGALNFLEYYCKKNNRELNDILKFESSDLGDSFVCEYTCQGCEEKIQGFSCKNNHLNMFCSLTFSPIEGFEYLSCRWCNRTARIELAFDNPKCLMCDVNLVVL